MVDANKEIRRAVDTGKVLFGVKQSEKSVLKGSAQLVIIPSNAPKPSREMLCSFAEKAGIPVMDFEGNSVELGSVCGKPFAVSAMVVENQGKSGVIPTAKKQ